MDTRAASIEEIKGFFQKIRDLYKESDRKFQEQSREMNKRFAETDRQIKETSKKVGELGNRLGEFVEEMVKPGIAKLFQERSVNIRAQIGAMQAADEDGGIQVDLVVKNTTEMVLIECKSKVSVDDVNAHLACKAKFKTYFPEYADKKIMGAMAGMVVPQDVARYAYHKGLFVLAQSGEVITILNDEKFEPRIW